MKNLLRHAVASAVLTAVTIHPAFAADAGAKSPSPDRKATCTHEARGLKGVERDDFIAWCMKQDIAGAKQARAPAPGSQQDKMRTCNAEAKQKALKGDERRSFMSACLRG